MRDWDEYFANGEFPMPRDVVTEYTQDRLEKLRSVGIEFVRVHGCGLEGEDCDGCLGLKGKAIPIAEAPNLPLPDCDKEFCKCILVVAGLE